ncbi:unnamed protein product [Schistocephalus solidus]|uniref:Transmembrane protein 164 n=1 Tax=Schistocephalus solidus TaxID=70667 RepID=A0A183S7D6_SCHSO|nr:unnamed protein product [Schistocephalus solidus]
MALPAFIKDGIDLSISGVGGFQCLHYLSFRQKFFESVFYCILSLCGIFWALPKLNLPFNSSLVSRNLQTKSILLCVHCIVFGIEVGFKFATSSFIWILNPCHVLTVIQIWLLLADPSELVTGVFRIHFHMLNGPLLALLFPVVNTRILPFETVVYYLQHLLILLIPSLLIEQQSVYSVEPLLDFSWVIFSISLQVLYHFLVLQPMSVITMVNLNNMLCPAVSDPFAGPYYRVIAMTHQPLLILILGKIFACLVLRLRGSSASKTKFSCR